LGGAKTAEQMPKSIRERKDSRGVLTTYTFGNFFFLETVSSKGWPGHGADAHICHN
jgi:hypothetical protein